MPELPEVETVARGLRQLIVKKVIKNTTSDTPKSFPNNPVDVGAFLVGASIIGVRRRAKVLLIDLDSDYTLVIHLKMTGQLVYRDSIVRFGAGHPNDSLIGELPDRSTRVTLDFTDGSHLYFNDQRKFGWMKLLPTIEVPNIDFMKKVGPEPLEADFTAAEFAQRFKRRAKTSIKAALLDQTVVAGVGNIYADESLWGAKIHPLRLVGSLTPAEFSRLYTELRAVMNLAIEKGGSTDKNYVNAEGKRGSYMDFARVFRREGQPCPRCGTTIIKFKAAGRGTHICPYCQKIGYVVMTNPNMSPADHDPTAFTEACRLAALDKAENPRFVRDRNGHAHWAAEYPNVFTFDGQLRGMFDLVHSDPAQRPDEQLAIAEGHPGGALTHVIIETDADERILIRKTSQGVQSASYQTFVLTSTGMARQAAEQGKLLEPRPIATQTLAGVVLVPGTVMQLGYDPHTGTSPRSRGAITRITGMQMDEAGKVAPDALQQPETDAYEIFNSYIRGIEATRRVGGEALRQIQIQKKK